MAQYIINGGHKIDGSIEVETSKNAFLPILAGCMICEGEVVLHNYPQFLDVENMCKILTKLDIKLVRQGSSLVIDSRNAKPNFISVEDANKLRSSVFIMGAMLARFKTARVPYPGGCAIGLRPIDLHIKGFKDLGVDVKENHGIIALNSQNLHGGDIFLDFASVGATENLILCTVIGKNRTILHNVAKEPEVVDLVNFLNKMGARISGAGTSTIIIDGVEKLGGGEYTPIKDRIIAGTYLIAGAITGGKIEVCGVNSQILSSLINKLRYSGCFLSAKSDKIYIRSPKRLKSVGSVSTQAYPGFPTDLQSQLLTLQTISQGEAVIVENLFESRFKFVPELIKMGANIKIKGRTAFVKGVKGLSGAEVYAQDLRGGASLVLAGLCANGYTRVYDIHHIDRGYENLASKLKCLGADIKVEE